LVVDTNMVSGCGRGQSQAGSFLREKRWKSLVVTITCLDRAVNILSAYFPCLIPRLIDYDEIVLEVIQTGLPLRSVLDRAQKAGPLHS